MAVIVELKEDVEPYERIESNRSRHFGVQEASWSSRQLDRRERLDSGHTDGSEILLRNSFNETVIPKTHDFQRELMRINSESDFELLHLTSKPFKEFQSIILFIRIWKQTVSTKLSRRLACKD